MSATAVIVSVVVFLIALPFYLFFISKLTSAGWTAGKFSYLQFYRGRSHNGKDDEQVH